LTKSLNRCDVVWFGFKKSFLRVQTNFKPTLIYI